MTRDPTKALIAGLILCILTAAYVWRADNPEAVCADRDIPATERLFSSCIASTGGGSSNAAYNCRLQVERLACKSWSRP